MFVNKPNRQNFSSSLNPKARVEFVDKVLGESWCYIESIVKMCLGIILVHGLTQSDTMAKLF